MELDLKDRTNCLESQVRQWQLVRLNPDYREFFDSIPEELFDNDKSYDVTDILGEVPTTICGCGALPVAIRFCLLFL